MGTHTPKPYSDRTDIEKLQSNWTKLTGLMKRKEWSAAVTRAATAAEIAANIAVRHELQVQRNLEAAFVDHLLKWANGLSGKIDKLLKPLHTTTDRAKALKSLTVAAGRINEQRNAVVHSGAFMNATEANEVVALAREFSQTMIAHYDSTFKLAPIPEGKA